MIPLRRQISALAELVFSADQDRGSLDWYGVSVNLKVVAAIENVDTGTPPGPPSFCEGLDDSDEGFADMTRLRVGGMIVFTLTWQAYEAATHVFDPATKAAGVTGRELLGRIDPGRRIPLLPELLAEARATVEASLSSTSHAIDYAKVDDLLGRDLVPAAAAEFARQFRNGIVHGWFPSPMAGLASEDDGSTALEPAIMVYGQMTRLVAVLIQLLFSLSFADDEMIEYQADEIAAHELLDSFHMA